MSVAQSATADLILRNGRFYTVDRVQPWAEAIAVGAGHILAVGSEAEVLAFANGQTEIVDLGGAMAMPGIIDGHNHVLMGGQTELYELRVPGSLSLAELCSAVRTAAESAARLARAVATWRDADRAFASSSRSESVWPRNSAAARTSYGGRWGPE